MSSLSNKIKVWIFFYLLLVCLAIQAKELPRLSNKLLLSENTKFYKLQVRELLTGLAHPWSLVWFPSSSISGFRGPSSEASLITERNGSLWLHLNKQLYELADIPPDVLQSGQGGYLGLYYRQDKQTFYLSYVRRITSKTNTIAIVSFQLSYAKNTFSMSKRQDILVIEPAVARTYHYGSVITADSESLYISLGERQLRSQAQDLQTYWGTIVRLKFADIDGLGPNANPYIRNKAPVLANIYSYGHRNPQGLLYDLERQHLWSVEHGPQGGDELNLIRAGRNYGWPIITYGVEYGSAKKIGLGTHRKGMEQPSKYWTPSPALSGLSIIKGNSKNLFPKWEGNIIIASLKFQRLYRLELSRDPEPVVLSEEAMLINKLGRLRWVGHGADGALYILTDQKNGRLLRVVPVN